MADWILSEPRTYLTLDNAITRETFHALPQHISEKYPICNSLSLIISLPHTKLKTRPIDADLHTIKLYLNKSTIEWVFGTLFQTLIVTVYPRKFISLQLWMMAHGALQMPLVYDRFG